MSDDPVPPGVALDLEEALRILSSLEDALDALVRAEASLGLQDELATMIALLHRRLGLGPGGVL